MRRILDFVLRVYSYVFTAASGVVLVGLGIVSKASGSDLNLQSMPWKGSELTTWLMVLGFLGIISAAAGAFGRGPLRYLLPIWNLAFTVLIIRGNFMSSAKSYESVSEFQWTIAFAVGAVGSLLASLMVFQRRRGV